LILISDFPSLPNPDLIGTGQARREKIRDTKKGAGKPEWQIQKFSNLFGIQDDKKILINQKEFDKSNSYTFLFFT